MFFNMIAVSRTDRGSNHRGRF